MTFELPPDGTAPIGAHLHVVILDLTDAAARSGDFAPSRLGWAVEALLSLHRDGVCSIVAPPQSSRLNRSRSGGSSSDHDHPEVLTSWAVVGCTHGRPAVLVPATSAVVGEQTLSLLALRHLDPFSTSGSGSGNHGGAKESPGPFKAALKMAQLVFKAWAAGQQQQRPSVDLCCPPLRLTVTALLSQEVAESLQEDREVRELCCTLLPVPPPAPASPSGTAATCPHATPTATCPPHPAKDALQRGPPAFQATPRLHTAAPLVAGRLTGGPPGGRTSTATAAALAQRRSGCYSHRLQLDVVVLHAAPPGPSPRLHGVKALVDALNNGGNGGVSKLAGLALDGGGSVEAGLLGAQGAWCCARLVAVAPPVRHQPLWLQLQPLMTALREGQEGAACAATAATAAAASTITAWPATTTTTATTPTPTAAPSATIGATNTARPATATATPATTTAAAAAPTSTTVPSTLHHGKPPAPVPRPASLGTPMVADGQHSLVERVGDGRVEAAVAGATARQAVLAAASGQPRATNGGTSGDNQQVEGTDAAVEAATAEEEGQEEESPWMYALSSAATSAPLFQLLGAGGAASSPPNNTTTTSGGLDFSSLNMYFCSISAPTSGQLPGPLAAAAFGATTPGSAGKGRARDEGSSGAPGGSAGGIDPGGAATTAQAAAADASDSSPLFVVD